MPVITLIKPQKSLRRFNVFLDGQFSFSIDKESLIKLKLKKDQKVSLARLKDFRRQAFKAKTIESLLNLLSYRPRSQKEIATRLKRYLEKSKTIIADLYSESQKQNLAEEILRFFVQKNLINDEEFSRWWQEQRNKFRPRGQRMLYAELLKKGIDKDIIQKVLATEEQKSQDQNHALTLAQKKLNTLALKHFPRPILREKLGRFLAAKGFDWPTISATLKAVLKNE